MIRLNMYKLQEPRHVCLLSRVWLFFYIRCLCRFMFLYIYMYFFLRPYGRAADPGTIRWDSTSWKVKSIFSTSVPPPPQIPSFSIIENGCPNRRFSDNCGANKHPEPAKWSPERSKTPAKGPEDSPRAPIWTQTGALPECQTDPQGTFGVLWAALKVILETSGRQAASTWLLLA